MYMAHIYNHMYYHLLCADIITASTSQNSWTEQAHTIIFWGGCVDITTK